jgi:hypothetical protein
MTRPTPNHPASAAWEPPGSAPRRHRPDHRGHGRREFDPDRRSSRSNDRGFAGDPADGSNRRDSFERRGAERRGEHGSDRRSELRFERRSAPGSDRRSELSFERRSERGSERRSDRGYDRRDLAFEHRSDRLDERSRTGRDSERRSDRGPRGFSPDRRTNSDDPRNTAIGRRSHYSSDQRNERDIDRRSRRGHGHGHGHGPQEFGPTWDNSAPDPARRTRDTRRERTDHRRSERTPRPGREAYQAYQAERRPNRQSDRDDCHPDRHANHQPSRHRGDRQAIRESRGDRQAIRESRTDRQVFRESRTDRRQSRAPRHTPGPIPEHRAIAESLAGARRALHKLTHAYLAAMSTTDSTHRDQARDILTAARRDLHAILTPEA